MHTWDYAVLSEHRMRHAALFISALQARPDSVLQPLSHKDLLNLAVTCQACKDIVCFALLPQTQDVSANHEATAIRCPISLYDVSRAIVFCRANSVPL